MKTLLILCVVIIFSFASDTASKIDKGTDITNETSTKLKEVDNKNISVLNNTKLIQVKIGNLENIQEKINSQNSK